MDLFPSADVWALFPPFSTVKSKQLVPSSSSTQSPSSKRPVLEERPGFDPQRTFTASVDDSDGLDLLVKAIASAAMALCYVCTGAKIDNTFPFRVRYYSTRNDKDNFVMVVSVRIPPIQPSECWPQLEDVQLSSRPFVVARLLFLNQQTMPLKWKLQREPRKERTETFTPAETIKDNQSFLQFFAKAEQHIGPLLNKYTIVEFDHENFVRSISFCDVIPSDCEEILPYLCDALVQNFRNHAACEHFEVKIANSQLLVNCQSCV